MERKDEFYIGYSNSIGKHTKGVLKHYLLLIAFLIITFALIFGYFQKPAANSSFDYDTITHLSGIYHESPYPMLRVKIAENTFKDVVLLGFGKYGSNPYLDEIKKQKGSLIGQQLIIQGNLIYYNGKTLLQIDESNIVEIETAGDREIPVSTSLEYTSVEGEIVDPKCFFGVMKPGYGKIHRSCAARCISGGIPPVLVAQDPNGFETYYLLTDLKGNPINQDILPYIGQPLKVSGKAAELGEWRLLNVELANIQKLDRKSNIYN